MAVLDALNLPRVYGFLVLVYGAIFLDYFYYFYY